MANLIRLKQIESGSALQSSAEIGTNITNSVNNIVSQSLETTFSASIVNIITTNIRIKIWVTFLINHTTFSIAEIFKSEACR